MTKTDLIRQITLYRCPVKLKEPFVISLGKLEFADNIIVVIETNEGSKGFGECSPFQTIHGENGDTCIAVGKVLAKSLLGKNVLDISLCCSVMDSVIANNTSIKSAFDIALYDISSKKSGLPLYRFLGGKINRLLATDYTVSIGTAEKMSEDAEKILNAGFPVIKIKLGGSEEEDVMRMTTIREKVGDSIPLRIDANQGWNKKTAINILNRLKDFNIQHCEEPIPRHDFLNLPEIKKNSPIPIMADESCFDHHDAMRLISLQACDLLNVKLGKSSGIFKALKIIRIAENANIKLQAGGFLESRLGFTATAHLALSSSQFHFIDFDTPLMFDHDPITGGIEYMEKGMIKIPETIGLGATVSTDVLKSLQSVTIN
jgi:L-alanine-DL-glutamate epimerase-like enolase superfamily enzyme